MLGSYKVCLIGSSHSQQPGGICQDAAGTVCLENGWMAAAVADGLGSAARSDIGSTVAVDTVLDFVKRYIPQQWENESMQALLRIAFHTAQRAVAARAQQDKMPLSEYDTTLTAAIYNGRDVVYGHVGDGGIVILNSDGEFDSLTCAQKGEAFNTTYPLASGPKYWTFGNSHGNICGFLMMTDGIYDIACPWPLRDQPQKVYVHFIRPFIDRNILQASTQEDLKQREAEIAAYFSKYIPEITDDKTIVGVMDTEVVPRLQPEEYYQIPDWERIAYEAKQRAEKRMEDEANAQQTQTAADTETPTEEPEIVQTEPAEPARPEQPEILQTEPQQSPESLPDSSPTLQSNETLQSETDGKPQKTTETSDKSTGTNCVPQRKKRHRGKLQTVKRMLRMAAKAAGLKKRR